MTLIGIPILTLVLATIRPLLASSAGFANSLLDARIAPAQLSAGGEGDRPHEGLLDRFSELARIAYLLARFLSVGLATFTVAVSAYATARSI